MLEKARKHIIQMVVLAFAGTTIFCSCSTDIEMVNALSEHEDTPGITSINSEMNYTEKGVIKLKVTAPRTLYFQFAEEPYSEFPEGIAVFSFTDSSTIESKLTANYAIHYDKKELWIARNNVIAMNKKGEILNTEELQWDQAKKIIFSDVNVKITRADGVIFGKGFVSDERFEKWELKQISGEFFVNKE